MLTEKLNFVVGKNFSGRTAYLKELTLFGQPVKANGDLRVYLGPVAVNFLSAMAGTIRGEIYVHGRDHLDNQRWMGILNFLDSLEFEATINQNPFQASGGEQSVIAVISSLMMNPRHLAIDVTLEQLSEPWRRSLLSYAASDEFPHTKVHVADNRIAETGEGNGISRMVLQTNENAIGSIAASNLADCYSREASEVVLADVNFNYDRERAVIKDASFKFEPGKVYHLRGKNGAGKSTLAKILVGVLPMQGQGKTYVNGTQTKPYNNPGKIFGYSYQNPDEQFFFSNVQEELASIQRDSEGIRRQERIQEIFGLKKFLSEHPLDLPFTIRKRISIAAALAQDRPWYIFDEPTLGLDDENVAGLADVFKELVRIGKGILIISHSMTIFRALGDLKWEEVILSDGRLHV